MQLDMSSSVSDLIWNQKYRLKSFEGKPLENSIEETWDRIAKAISINEVDSDRWTRIFRESFENFLLIPGGRITAGVGTGRDVTFVNTFMMGLIPDQFSGIYHSLSESAVTLRSGGGIGCDFSLLRPKSSKIYSLVAPSSGPLPYMDLWDQMCHTTMMGGLRRGAMMAVLRCDHPDILDFVGAKRSPNRLLRLNISVLVTDEFIKAALEDSPWLLRHNGTVFKTVSAAELWIDIMKMTYDYSEPGVVFIDRMNSLNNLKYIENIIGTNSCGEMPLPPYGSAPLASINLARLVEEPFRSSAHLNLNKFANLVRIGIRLLDNILDITRYPLEQQRSEARNKRRIGLGVTGLADALIMCGATYGTPQADALVTEWMNTLRTESYLASVDLSEERGHFPLFHRDKFLQAISYRHLPEYVVSAIRRSGIRNGVLTAIAPAGTMSMYAGNVSSGIEPVFSFVTDRNIILDEDQKIQVKLSDFAFSKYTELNGSASPLPPNFVTANELTPRQHLSTQALVQRYIDSSISKTINCPADLPFSKFVDIYMDAYRLGCKGCSTYRPSHVRGYVMSEGS